MSILKLGVSGSLDGMLDSFPFSITEDASDLFFLSKAKTFSTVRGSYKPGEWAGSTSEGPVAVSQAVPSSSAGTSANNAMFCASSTLPLWRCGEAIFEAPFGGGESSALEPVFGDTRRSSKSDVDN